MTVKLYRFIGPHKLYIKQIKNNAYELTNDISKAMIFDYETMEAAFDKFGSFVIHSC
ncbi:hypothetical protein [Erysipelothrix anatis]|uniref:hypothetical protein n=1 Tax=Erysipelothrix anatis TaxID=2683713 RepID=UPI001358D32A|nr:hypothetical protein [Erysipelothrix anatis]